MGISVVTMAGHNRAYEQINNTDIFTGIELPEGVDRDTLINRIMVRCMEFNVMHTDPDFMHFQILNFFKVHYRTFEKWVKALEIEYNPLENYDRSEAYMGSGSNSGSNSLQGSNSSTDTTTRASFNSSEYEPYERDSISGSNSSSGSNSGQYSDQHSIRVHGNIGVTTSQQMLQSELDVQRFNIYTAIADMFADEFCVMVY